MIPLSKLAKRKYEKNYVEKKKTDSGGVVRIYDEKHVKNRWKKKETRLKNLEKSITKLRKKYHADLKSDDPKTRAIAAAVGLMDDTAMRVGNEDSVDEFETFGATTLQKRHVHTGGKLRFKFLGKSNVDQDHVLHDGAVAKEIRALLKGKKGKDKIFEYEDGKSVSPKIINRYLAEFDITAKDLRGFHANKKMKEALRHKDWDAALKEVAEEVGHEPKTLENQYLARSLVEKHKPEKSTKDDKKKDDKPKKKKKSWLIPMFKIAHSHKPSGSKHPGGHRHESGGFMGSGDPNYRHQSGRRLDEFDDGPDLFGYETDEEILARLERELGEPKKKLAYFPMTKNQQKRQAELEQMVDQILGERAPVGEAAVSRVLEHEVEARKPSTFPISELQKKITSPYHERKDPITGVKDFHHGTDIGTPVMTPIVAIGSGIVEAAGWEKGKSPPGWVQGKPFTGKGGEGFGLRVRIKHRNGYVSIYGHLAQILVNEGQEIKRGEQIGYSGQSGRATGPHLHLSLKDPKGQPVDPMSKIR